MIFNLYRKFRTPSHAVDEQQMFLSGILENIDEQLGAKIGEKLSDVVSSAAKHASSDELMRAIFIIKEEILDRVNKEHEKREVGGSN